MTTLIRNFFRTEQLLMSFLDQRIPNDIPATPLKAIIRIGYINDLLSEPRGTRHSQSADSYISWLETQYLTSIANKTITRVGNGMGTIPDPVVDLILSGKFGFSEEELRSISKQHRLSMQAENLIGCFLEEYLEERLVGTGWICCYGETLKYSDFCHNNNSILQVKNRDNTENSSSKKIRKNNPRIKMWFRTYSQTGNTNWENIYPSLGLAPTRVALNEEDFKNFVRQRIAQNPAILAEE